MTSDRHPFRETLDSGLTHYQGYFNLRTRLACDLILATGEQQGGRASNCGVARINFCSTEEICVQLANFFRQEKCRCRGHRRSVKWVA